MKLSRLYSKRHRVSVPGLLTSRFRRRKLAVPVSRIAEREQLSRWEMRQYDDPWDEASDWKPWEREGSNRVSYWRTRQLVQDIQAEGGCTLAKQVRDVAWERVAVRGSGLAVPHIARPMPERRWSVEELPGVLLERLNDLTRDFTTPLTTLPPVSRKELATFNKLVEDTLEQRWQQASLGGVLAALHLCPLWVRRPADFVPVPDATPRENMRDLMEHLFALYALPACLRNAWQTQYEWSVPSLRWIAWFILAGQGASIQRHAALFGEGIAPQQWRWFLRAPAELVPAEARAWAEIRALGGGDEEQRRIEAHAAYDRYRIDWCGEYAPGCLREDYEVFWEDAVRWLRRHRDAVTDEMCRSILAWAMFRLTRAGFSWKGRSPAQAHRLAREHERQMRLQRYGIPDLSWAARGWNMTWQDNGGREWSMTELTSAEELFDEGQAMSHCVAGYAPHCASGGCAIFSMRLQGERCLTVEVTRPELQIGEIRGSCNREATGEEREQLARWLSSQI